MVEWLGLPKKAHQIEAVVQRALAKGARTPDLGERQDGGCDGGRERIFERIGRPLGAATFALIKWCAIRKGISCRFLPEKEA
jgi:hypothetical protein